MKKQLLLGAMLFGALFTAKAQTTLYDFNDLTVGNIATDYEVPGQGDWYTFAGNGDGTTTNMGNSTFQVVNSNNATYGNVFSLTGPNGNSGAAYMWQNGTDEWWASRTEGDDILEVEYDFYTGTPGASLNNMQVLVYDSTYQIILGGITVNMNTLEVSGLSYYNNNGTFANYRFSLGTEADPNVILPSESWVHLAFSFNYNTGEVMYVGPGFSGSVPGAAAGIAPQEIDFVANSGSTQTTSNTAAATGWFDNLEVSAVATGTLNNSVFDSKSTFVIYPNPTTDIINVANANDAINAISVTDLNGRVVRSASFNGVSEATVNVADLAKGVYMVTVSSAKGSTTQKIVKN